jgi:hypothetical protein
MLTVDSKYAKLLESDLISAGHYYTRTRAKPMRFSFRLLIACAFCGIATYSIAQGLPCPPAGGVCGPMCGPTVPVCSPPTVPMAPCCTESPLFPPGPPLVSPVIIGPAPPIGFPCWPAQFGPPMHQTRGGVAKTRGAGQSSARRY